MCVRAYVSVCVCVCVYVLSMCVNVFVIAPAVGTSKNPGVGSYPLVGSMSYAFVASGLMQGYFVFVDDTRIGGFAFGDGGGDGDRLGGGVGDRVGEGEGVYAFIMAGLRGWGEGVRNLIFLRDTTAMYRHI